MEQVWNSQRTKLAAHISFIGDATLILVYRSSCLKLYFADPSYHVSCCLAASTNILKLWLIRLLTTTRISMPWSLSRQVISCLCFLLADLMD